MSKKQVPSPTNQKQLPTQVKSSSGLPTTTSKSPPAKKIEPIVLAPIKQVSKAKENVKQVAKVEENKFNPDKYVKANCPRAEVIELKKAFDIFDEDLSGTIDPTELRLAFEAMGIQSDSKLIYQVLGELDEDNSGGIDFEEFFKLATSRHNVRETKQDIRRAFNLFDFNREGRITWDELKRVAMDLGEYENDDQIRTCFKKGDLDQDGFVTFEDFYQIMTGSKTYYG